MNIMTDGTPEAVFLEIAIKKKEYRWKLELDNLFGR
jgi:hypothetical protein